MRQRAIELGGELRIVNRPPGTLLEVVIPIKEAVRERSSLAA